MMKVGSYPMSALAVAVFAVLFTAEASFHTPHVHAQSRGSDHESRVERGFEIAPVGLNLEGKNRELVSGQLSGQRGGGLQ